MVKEISTDTFLGAATMEATEISTDTFLAEATTKAKETVFIMRSPAATESKQDDILVKAAFLNFCKVMRFIVVRENPSIAFSEVGRELKARWEKLSDAQEEKVYGYGIFGESSRRTD